MCKLQLNRLGKISSWIASLKLGAIVLLGLAATTSWAAPANDNFKNAAVINGNNGTTTGSNVGATAEPQEPVDAGVGGGKTIWYKWTAPFSGTILFNTEGSSFDTVMAIYTGTNVAGLGLVAQNDDVAFPNDLTSQVTFAVTAGTNYFISVDGNEGDSGSVILNWLPIGTHSGGNISFASGITDGLTGFPLYVNGEDDADGTIPVGTGMTYLGNSARVVRNVGTAGKILIDYVITNMNYTDLFVTNFFGTNVFVNNSDGTFTNVFFTNVVAISFIQTYANNALTYTVYSNGFSVTFTNVNGQNSRPLITDLGTNLALPFPCVNTTLPPGLSTNTTTGVVSTTTTNIFCLPGIITTNIIASATPGIDFLTDHGTITMNDFQAGVNIPYTVLPFATEPGAIVDFTTLRNHLAVIKISNARLDPLEGNSGNIAAPIIMDNTAYVQILNDSIVGPEDSVDKHVGALPSGQAANAVTTNSIANFIFSHNWVTENLGTNGQSTARILLMRTGTNFTSSLSVDYVVDVNPNNQAAQDYDFFPLQPGSDYATPPTPPNAHREISHFGFTTGTITWGARDALIKELDFTITNDPAVQFNEDVVIQLRNPSGGAIGLIGTTVMTILFNDQPAGAIDRDHNPNNVANSNPPFNANPGAGGSNDTVYATAIQPDNKTIIGGDFRTYNGTTRNRVARMNADGSLDTGFMATPNGGADNTVTCLALQPDGRVIIGGVFGSFNAISRPHIARLNTDGSLDTNFNSGLGVNGTVSALALQPDGRVIIGGTFTFVNSTNRNNIARLNPDGSLDTTFNPAVGPNGAVNALALQADGKVVVGGAFTMMDNIPFRAIARLNPDGSLDGSFNPGPGADNIVNALVEQPDGKILVGGSFSTINLVPRNAIARLNSDGTTDLTFDPGTGSDDIVYTVALQQDANILIGGSFTSVNGTRRIGLARLFNNGPVDTSFLDTSYNQFAGLINPIANQVVQPKNFLRSINVQPDGNVIIGGRFSQLGGGVNYGYSNINRSATIANGIATRDAVSPRRNVARLIGGSTPGPGNIGLVFPSYSADKANQSFFVSLQRANGALGTASVTFQPSPLHAGVGNATPNVDYGQTVQQPTWGLDGSIGQEPINTWNGLSSDDYSGLNNLPVDAVGRPGGFINSLINFVNIFDNPNSSGNLNLNLQLTQPVGSLTLGGEPIPAGVALGIATAPLTIVDNSVAAGTVGFTMSAYFVSEGATNAVISVTRTNGSTGPVSVGYQTVPGTGPLGALPGATNDYMDVSGTLNFDSGVTNLTFTVPIVNNFIVRPDRTLSLILTNVSGGGLIGTGVATLTIINNNFKSGTLSFLANNGTNVPNYSVHEDAGVATITVTRLGGSIGTEKISFTTADGSATHGLDYDPTNGVLTWGNGDTTNKTFNVILHNRGLVNSNITVNLVLSNALTNGVFSPAAFGEFTNAVLTIINDNFFGSPTLSAPTYFVNDNAGAAIITVNRLGGSSQAISVDYTTTDGTAKAGTDYTFTSGTLTFQDGQFSQSFSVPVTASGSPNSNDLQFNIVLGNAQPSAGPGGGVVLGSPSNAVVTIVNNQIQDQPPGSPDTTYNAGAAFNAPIFAMALQTNGSLVVGGDFTQANGILRNRIARLDPNGFLDVKFSSGNAGANASVRAMAIQTDGSVLVGGLFNIVNSFTENYVARLNFDGSLDSTFNTGIGADNPVYAIAETFSGPTIAGSNRKIVIGGSFASVGGVPYRSIAQLNQDGSVDTTFNAAGANGTVYAVAVYSQNDDINGGKILIGGDFTMVNGVNVNHIARLNADGTLDNTFNIPINNQVSGPNDSVRSIAIQVDGNVLIGGLFTSVAGVPLNFIARMNPFGQVDPSFNVGVGANDAVSAIVIQQDLKILLGGIFTDANGVTRNRLTRLNSDGTVDSSINFGQGANDFIDAIVVQQDSKIVVGGGFTQFDGEIKQRIARIYGGSETGSGSVQFVSANYQVNESATNIVIGLSRVGGTSNSITVVATTSDGTAISGVDYTGVTNLITFGEGETFRSFTIPILIDPTNMGQLSANLTLTDPNTGSLIIGNQSESMLTIIGANSTVSFSAANYAVNKANSGGGATITVIRNNSTIGPASVDFITTTNGTASPFVDFTPVTNTLFFLSGQTNATVLIPISTNGIGEGNLTIGLALINPTNTALDPTLPTTATLTVVDSSQAPGNLEFSAASYSVLQTSSNAVITVIRTNGSLGTVSVNYTTSGGTATPNVDYVPTSGTLSFIDGQLSKSFTVPIRNNTNLTSDVTLDLSLTSTGSGNIVGPPTVTLTIVNQNLDVSFAQGGYFVDEKNGSLTVGVTRSGNTNATAVVNYGTSDGTAKVGANYLTTSGTLTFLPGQTFETFIIPIIDDPQITGNLIFFVNLTNAGGAQVRLINPVTTTVTILDDDSGFSLGAESVTILKGATNAIIPVLRMGSTAGSASVAFSASGGTAPTTEYVPTNGVVTFLSGQTSNFFTVQILNDNQIDGDQTVSLALSSPSPGSQLLAPSTGTLTIFDNESGFSFSSANYSVNENGVAAVITVIRSGVTNTTASVNYTTTDGTGVAGGQYRTASGTLTFTNGQTTATFNVPIIDNNITGGSKTVNLLLSAPSDDSTLINPVAAVLTIFNNDGSLIVAAGSAVLVPTNGIIVPNTQVTALLSLLNIAGSNTAVTATLQTNNGVTVVGNATQNYGVLNVGGPSVFRPFVFSVNGTNGGSFNAVLKLQYGNTNTTVSYTFTLGTSTNLFTNSTFITINDLTNATPYPSSITISNLNGLINKVTATVNKMGHAYSSDISILLVGPAGVNTLLMEEAGGPNTFTNVTLTFDSTASSSLTTATPVSGTYQPSALQTGAVFPTSATGVKPPAGPYNTSLTNFNNTNPNGTWSLFVDDTKFLDTGSINQGWTLAISTLNMVTPNVDLAVGLSATPNPVVVSNSLTYTIAVTNAGPSSATGVTVTNVLPPGLTNVSVTSSQGTSVTNASGNIVTTLGSMATNGTATIHVIAVPTLADIGLITNAVSVGSHEVEDNAPNNTATLVTTVQAPNADLAIGVSPTPNPVGLGNNVTYTITVINLGPATAPSVSVTNVLPAGVTLISDNAPGGFTTNADGSMNSIIGNLAIGDFRMFNLVAKEGLAGTNASTFIVGSSAVPDPLKGNNSATVKVIVQGVPLTLSVSRSGSSLTFTWPATGTYVLQSTPSLAPPVTWTTVTNNSPSVSGGMNTETLPIGGGSQYFRLSSQ